MSPANSNHFVVRAHDYDLWQVVVVAKDRDDALAKAKSMYATDGFGNTDAFVHFDRSIDWEAFELVPEVVR